MRIINVSSLQVVNISGKHIKNMHSVIKQRCYPHLPTINFYVWRKYQNRGKTIALSLLFAVFKLHDHFFPIFHWKWEKGIWLPRVYRLTCGQIPEPWRYESISWAGETGNKESKAWCWDTSCLRCIWSLKSRKQMPTTISCWMHRFSSDHRS